MDYGHSPEPVHTLKQTGVSNPLMGDSNYEQRRRALHSEYKDYIRKSVETSRERSLSKREAKHIEKIRETSSKSPRNQEQNLYATK